MTWARARHALARLQPGQALEVIVDQGKPATELPRSAKSEGHRVRSVVRDGDQVRFLVECGGLGAAARGPASSRIAPPPAQGPSPQETPAQKARAIPAHGLSAQEAPASAPLPSQRPSAQDTAARASHAGYSNPALRRYDSVAELIGDPENPTPLVRLGRMAPEGTDLSVKLEWMNPFGSIKDRTAKYLLEGLRQRGALEGKQLVEPTSGNTGIALVALANLLRVKATVTIPTEVPAEKQTLLRLLGATVWPTPDNLCPIDHPRDGAIALAHSIAVKPGYVMPNQYENPDNVRAHYETTGPEIWKQTEGKVRAVVAGYGTCGTLTGIARFLKEKDPAIHIVAIEPTPGHRLPGLKSFKESKRPAILDPALIDETLVIEDELAYRTAIRLAREESLLVGPSTGAIVAGALQVAERVEGTIVAISPDSAFKYVSSYLDRVGQDGQPGEL